ncbi:ABC transporter ATP-binding protein [Halogeometricum borinquense]|uniref:ABC transporter ATP-binding protein n=1 Tax=Halogeometricum borinquense TaxID=60847 RepID=A0A6C0UK84_9EURY|nr:ABC transporter ATP-binding protein [Halogeometricum borinquense]QIB75647.1 ABC transporter ATP-binding protein [Halogeometricum borinquense]
MNEQAAITTDGLTKTWDTTAVSDLNLSIPNGSIYGFLGPNGAGKTTTIQMLTALTKPTNGTGRIAGPPITDRNAVIPHIGYLPSEIEDRIEELLHRFDLIEDADSRISTYSKGMKQKTGLIQALLHNPDVIILDEPTSGLDPRAARAVRDTITELAANDTNVFLPTQILPVVSKLATEVGILYDGELVAEGPPEMLIERWETGEESTLEDVFLEVTTDGSYDVVESPES